MGREGELTADERRWTPMKNVGAYCIRPGGVLQHGRRDARTTKKRGGALWSAVALLPL